LHVLYILEEDFVDQSAIKLMEHLDVEITVTYVNQ
jgi:hypothetical protein